MAELGQGVAHDSVGTSLTQTEFEAADSHAISSVPFEDGGTITFEIKVEKVVKAHDSDLFDAAGLTDSANIWTQPAGSILLAAYMILDTQFAAPGPMTDLDVTLGLAGDNDGLLVEAMNLTSDAITTRYSTRGAYWDAASTIGALYKAAAETWVAYATAVGDNLGDTTAGQVTFYFVYLDVSGT